MGCWQCFGQCPPHMRNGRRACMSSIVRLMESYRTGSWTPKLLGYLRIGLGAEASVRILHKAKVILLCLDRALPGLPIDMRRSILIYADWSELEALSQHGVAHEMDTADDDNDMSDTDMDGRGDASG